MGTLFDNPLIFTIQEMKLIGRQVLGELKRQHQDVRSQVDSWEAEVEAAEWKTPLDIKNRYANASILPNNQTVFNLKGNKYRLWATIAYKTQIVTVRKGGTHEEYMKWVIQ